MWHKRRCCDAPGCVGSFTESSAQIPARKRLTERLRRGVAAAALDRSTAAVARSFRVSWHTAWDAVAAAAGAKLAARPPMPPRRLGVDETTWRPRRFMTGIGTWKPPGCGTRAAPRPRSPTGSPARRRRVAIEASTRSPRIGPAELLPHAVHVADRFHIERANTAHRPRRRLQQRPPGIGAAKAPPLHGAPGPHPRRRAPHRPGPAAPRGRLRRRRHPGPQIRMDPQRSAARRLRQHRAPPGRARARRLAPLPPSMTSQRPTD